MSDKVERLTEALGSVSRGPNAEASVNALIGTPEDLMVIYNGAVAYRDLLANGQRVEWCEVHGEHTHGKRFCAVGIDPESRTCRIVSKLLTDLTTEEENA